MSNPPASDETFTVNVEQRGDVAIVRLCGSTTMDTSTNLQERLFEAVDLPVKCLVLELSQLDFMTSAGLGAIMATYLRCRHRKCRMKLVGPQPRIVELLDLAKITELFSVYKTLDEALAV